MVDSRTVNALALSAPSIDPAGTSPVASDPCGKRPEGIHIIKRGMTKCFVPTPPHPQFVFRTASLFTYQKILTRRSGPRGVTAPCKSKQTQSIAIPQQQMPVHGRKCPQQQQSSFGSFLSHDTTLSTPQPPPNNATSQARHARQPRTYEKPGSGTLEVLVLPSLFFGGGGLAELLDALGNAGLRVSLPIPATACC
jgi:hypothetical protein